MTYIGAADRETMLAEKPLVEQAISWAQDVLATGQTTRFIVVPFDLPRGNCATYFPEANPLVPLDSTADKSNTPTSKSVIVRVEPARARAATNRV